MKTKSAAVIGTPSLQRASGRMWYVSVIGGLVVTVTLETSRGRHVRSGPTSNGASSTLLAMNPRLSAVDPGAHSSRSGERQAGSPNGPP